MATLKPPTPLLAPNKGPLKPTTPLRPKNATKTPISHPQRRWRFHTHAGTSEQRRQGFQTTGPPGRQGQAAAPAGPEAMSGPPFHTWSLSPARGPDDLHLGPMTCTRATPPRRMLRGLRAYQGVNAYVQGFPCEQHSTTDTVVPKTQTTSPVTSRFHRFSPRWSALWAPHHLKPRRHRHQTGEMTSLEPRHAGDTPATSF